MTMSSVPELRLKRGAERTPLNGHPWVYSGAVARPPQVGPGSVVDVMDHRGRFVLRGLYNPHSAIRVRGLTWDRDTLIDRQFFRRALSNALELRARAGLAGYTNAIRLVHGENDGLPGLVVDDYAGYLVVQFHTAGMEAYRAEVLDELWDLRGPRGIFERSDVGTRRAEKLHGRPTGLLRGAPPPDLVQIREHGTVLAVDLYHGQKTGLFLDQRDNRLLVQRLASGKSVLNCFAYTGAFSAHALRGGATRTLDVEITAGAAAAARRNLAANCAPGADWDYIRANVFQFLDDLAAHGPRFDMVILDPPSLVRKREQLEQAMGVYTKLNRNALRVVRTGGLLVTASCSARVSHEDFFQLVRRAAVGAQVRLRLQAMHLHPPDHPVDPAFPEGRYLKCITAWVLR